MQSPRHLTQTLTLAALGALVLSGCGQKATGSIPEPGDSSSSAASSVSVSAGGAGASDGATAEVTERFSGGSKAPEGEYRAADEQGPAQNVPKPEAPAGMNVESDEGLEKFLGYWAESVNYGTQTGDFTYALPLVGEAHEADIEYFAWTESLYSHGGWKAGGLRSVVLGEGLFVNQGNGTYTWGGNLIVQDSYTYHGGEMSFVDNSASETEGIYFEVEYKDSKWVMNGIELVGAN